MADIEGLDGEVPISVAYAELEMHIPSFDRESFAGKPAMDFHILYTRGLDDGYIYARCLDFDIMNYGYSIGQVDEFLFNSILHELETHIAARNVAQMFESEAPGRMWRVFNSVKREVISGLLHQVEEMKGARDEHEVSNAPTTYVLVETKTARITKKRVWALDEVRTAAA